MLNYCLAKIQDMPKIKRNSMSSIAVKNVLIIDDHPLFSEGLALILSTFNKKLKITTSSNPRHLLSDVTTLSSYDLLLIDLQMPTISGLAFLQAIKARSLVIPTLIVSSSDNRSDIENALKYGAKGFIPKSAPSHEIAKAINSVLAGNMYVPEHIVGSIDWNFDKKNTPRDNTLSSEKAVTLTPRQSEVIQLIHGGHSNSQIGDILNLTESTVKGHISSLFKTLNVRNRTACVNKAITLNVLNLG